MKSKKGFTLVELLAVVAILAVMAIIVLPNVVQLFKESKNQIFVTELKELYRYSEQKWISESTKKSGPKVYVKCNSGECNNTLDVTVRDNFYYYIEMDGSGKVVTFYATDGNYQYTHEGLLDIEEIDEVEDLGEIDELDSIIITCDGYITKSDDVDNCEYVIVSDVGSFSKRSLVREICFTPTNDNYKYTKLSVEDYSVERNEEFKYLFIRVFIDNMGPNSYLRVYRDSSKKQLLGKIDSSDLPLERINLSHKSYNKLFEITKLIGEYDAHDLYFEYSEDLDFEVLYTNDTTEEVFEGPWIADKKTLNRVQTMIQSLTNDNYEFVGITNCTGRLDDIPIYEPPKEKEPIIIRRFDEVQEFQAVSMKKFMLIPVVSASYDYGYDVAYPDVEIVGPSEPIPEPIEIEEENCTGNVYYVKYNDLYTKPIGPIGGWGETLK